jgi:hypothetical protein
MRCPKCNGCLHTEPDAIRCLNCGMHLYEPDPPEALTMDPARWQSVLCARCNGHEFTVKNTVIREGKEGKRKIARRGNCCDAL